MLELLPVVIAEIIGLPLLYRWMDKKGWMDREDEDKKERKLKDQEIYERVTYKSILFDESKMKNLRLNIHKKVESISQNELDSLKQYLRNVCYKKYPVAIKGSEKGYYIRIKGENPKQLALMENQTEKIVCTFADNLQIEKIDFLNYGENGRFLPRMFFEKVIKENLIDFERNKELEEEKTF